VTAAFIAGRVEGDSVNEPQGARISFASRIGYLALSGLAGWFAGQIATLPANLITAVRDSEGAPRLFLESIGLGLVAWGGWTLVLAGAALVFVALPIVLIVRPSLLVRFRVPIFWGAVGVAIFAVFSRLKGFRDPAATTRLLRFFEALPYGLFASVFAAVTAWVYISLAKRRMERTETDGMQSA
jgi:hypothetical protein